MYNMSLFDYDLQDNSKHWEEKPSVRQKFIITGIEKCIVSGNEGIKSELDVISAKSKVARWAPNNEGAEASNRGNKVVTKVSKSHTMMSYSSIYRQEKKNGSAPVTQVTVNTKNTWMCGDQNVVKKVLQVIKDKAMSLGFCRSNGSH